MHILNVFCHADMIVVVQWWVVTTMMMTPDVNADVAAAADNDEATG